jgi:hypothetical protein
VVVEGWQYRGLVTVRMLYLIFVRLAGWMAAVLLRLAYLTVMNTFAVLRLFPMSDREKDTEILAMRHQLGVLERQLGDGKVRFTPAESCVARGVVVPPAARGVTSAAAAGPPGYDPALAS